MNWSSIFEIASVALPTGLSLLGIYVSVELPSSTLTPRRRVAWRIGLFALGLITSLVVWKQQQLEREENYIPLLHLIYVDHQLQLFNDGRTYFHYVGNKLDGGAASIDAKGVVVSPGTFYFQPMTALEAEILRKFPEGLERRIPFDVYLTDQNGHHFTAHFALVTSVGNRTVVMRTQMIDLVEGGW